MSSPATTLTPVRCALCGGPMKLVQRTSVPDAQSPMAVYQCEKCRHMVTRPVSGEE